MMTDIVERLRAKHIFGAFEIEQQREEAAAEIERLRAGNAAQAASEHAAKQIDAVCDYLGENIDRLSRLLERDDRKPSRAHIEGARNAMASADNTLTQICLSLSSAQRPQQTAADNAALIAAIPEMVQVLKLARAHIDACDYDTEAIALSEHITAVLQKVKQP